MPKYCDFPKTYILPARVKAIFPIRETSRLANAVFQAKTRKVTRLNKTPQNQTLMLRQSTRCKEFFQLNLESSGYRIFNAYRISKASFATNHESAFLYRSKRSM